MDIVFLSEDQIKTLILKDWIDKNYLAELKDLFACGIYSITGELMSAAFFSKRGSEKNSAAFIGIYTEDKYKILDFEGEFFDAVFEALNRAKISEIYYGYASENEIDDDPPQTLDELGFEKKGDAEELYIFERGGMQGNSIDFLYENQDKIKYDICRISDYYDERLKVFWKKVKGSESFISKAQYNENLCVFALKEDVVVAALAAKEESLGRLRTRKAYLDDSIKNIAQIVPFLLANIVHNNKDDKLSFSEIYFTVKQKGFSAGVGKILEKPKFKGFYHEYHREMK